ncbi:MAG: hypothetical protein ACMXX8_00540 [Candidatus Woesearchaeota archaeon]
MNKIDFFQGNIRIFRFLGCNQIRINLIFLIVFIIVFIFSLWGLLHFLKKYNFNKIVIIIFGILLFIFLFFLIGIIFKIFIKNIDIASCSVLL